MAAQTQEFSLSGVFTALVTPFTRDASAVDYRSLEKLIELQLAAGVQGVVVCGSTGEASTLTQQEYGEVISFVRERTKGSLSCVAGISTSSTMAAIEMAKLIKGIGCDAILVAAPPYNRPTQEGLLEHFRAIARAVRIPLIAYNIPGRSAVGFTAATLATLSREGLIAGIKESSGSIDLLADIIRAVSPICQVVSGDDSLLLAVLAYGGSGAISASANVLPREFVELTTAYAAGRIDDSRKLQLGMLSKIRALFIESNPVPVKTALALQGVIAEPTVRLPLVPLSAASLATLSAEFLL